MTIQYQGGEPVELSPDNPPADQSADRSMRVKGGIFGQPYAPKNYRGLFARRHWNLPPEDQCDRAQDPDWTTKGVTYPVVGLVKRYHAQAMADKRQALYLASQGLGAASFNPGTLLVAGVGALVLGYFLLKGK